MELSIGRIVRYTLKRADLEELREHYGGAYVFDVHGDPIKLGFSREHVVGMGDVFPMMISYVGDDFTVNGTVYIGGGKTLWATSVGHGARPGGWIWPVPPSQPTERKTDAKTRRNPRKPKLP